MFRTFQDYNNASLRVAAECFGSRACILVLLNLPLQASSVLSSQEQVTFNKFSQNLICLGSFRDDSILLSGCYNTILMLLPTFLYVVFCQGFLVCCEQTPMSFLIPMKILWSVLNSS